MTALFRETGISPSALSNYRAVRIKRLSADKLSKIPDYFGMTTGSLLGKYASAQDAVAETSDMDVATPVDFTYAVYRESRTLSGEYKSALFDMAGLL